jgi:group I intron endonuclease
MRDLKQNKHSNKILQHSFNKYGINKFVFHIIETCMPERCLEIEQFYLDFLKPEFNIAKSSSAPMLGKSHNEKTRKKMSRPAWNKGIPRTNEEKLLMSIKRKEGNSKQTIEYWNRRKEIMLNTQKKYGGSLFKGKHHTEENKKKFRNLNKGNKIICINTGEIFECQNDAAKKYNIKQGHISENLNNKRCSVRGLKFKYV